MAESNSILNIVLQLKDDASAQISTFSGKLQDLQPAFRTMATVGAAGFAAISGEIYVALQAAGDAQVKLASMDATLKSVAGTSSDVRTKILDASKSFVQLGFDDESAAESMALMYQRTGDVTESLKLTSLAADLARAKHLDLESATKLVTLALSGSGRALLQYGISIKDSATPLEALGVLQEKVGGQAVAFSETLQGRMDALKVSTDNLQESIGTALMPALESILAAVQPLIEKFTVWATNNPQLLSQILLIGGGLSALLLTIGSIGLALPLIITGFDILLCPIGLVTGAVLALIATGAVIVARWQEMKDNFDVVWQNIKDIFTSAIDYIMAKLQPLINAFNTVTGMAKSVGGAIGGAISKILPFASGGIVTSPTIGLVGEAGPEAIIPLSQMGGMGGVYITINGDVSGDDLIEKVKTGIMGSLRLNTKFSA